MNSVEFGKKCRPYLKEYYNLFGVAPSPSDYVCTNEQFLGALIKAVTNKQSITELLENVEYPKDAKN